MGLTGLHITIGPSTYQLKLLAWYLLSYMVSEPGELVLVILVQQALLGWYLVSYMVSAHVADPFGLELGILYRNGHIFATRNKDKTCCIWDTQNLSKSVFDFKGNLGAIRSIQFTSDGQFMAMATPTDFVQVYDTSNGYNKEQEIDFFSEISGVYVSTDRLYSLGFGTEHMVASSGMV